MNNPRISILLPVFEAAPYLEQCLDSLFRQSMRDFEIIALDDGSTDGSAELLASAAARDPRLRVETREHRGLIPALNDALSSCRGGYVARMDADDISHPQRLQRQLTLLEHSDGADVVSCLVRHFPQKSLGEGFRIYETWLNRLVTNKEILLERFIESPIPHPTVMTRRRLMEEIGGYRDREWPEDYDLWLRLAAAGARFEKVPEVLYLWRHHESRLTRTHRRYAVERFLACKAEHLVTGPLTEHDAVVVWGAGQTGRRLSKHLKRLGAPLTAFIDIDRRKIGRTLRGFPICPPEELANLLAAHRKPVVVTAVSSRGGRALIRQQLRSLGLEEGRQFWCAA